MKYKVQVWEKKEIIHEARGLKQAETFFKAHANLKNGGRDEKNYFIHSIEPLKSTEQTESKE